MASRYRGRAFAENPQRIPPSITKVARVMMQGDRAGVKIYESLALQSLPVLIEHGVIS